MKAFLILSLAAMALFCPKVSCAQKPQDSTGIRNAVKSIVDQQTLILATNDDDPIRPGAVQYNYTLINERKAGSREMASMYMQDCGSLARLENLLGKLKLAEQAELAKKKRDKTGRKDARITVSLSPDISLECLAELFGKLKASDLIFDLDLRSYQVLIYEMHSVKD